VPSPLATHLWWVENQYFSVQSPRQNRWLAHLFEIIFVTTKMLHKKCQLGRKFGVVVMGPG